MKDYDPTMGQKTVTIVMLTMLALTLASLVLVFVTAVAPSTHTQGPSPFEFVPTYPVTTGSGICLPHTDCLHSWIYVQQP